MLRRLRRPAAALTFLLVLVPVVGACGSDAKKDTSDSSTGTVSGVSLTGAVGKEITAKWHKAIAQPKSAKVTTLVKGSGDKIASGDTVSTYVWIGNGSTKKVAFSDYQNGKAEPIPNNGQMSRRVRQDVQGCDVRVPRGDGDHRRPTCSGLPPAARSSASAPTTASCSSPTS